MREWRAPKKSGKRNLTGRGRGDTEAEKRHTASGGDRREGENQSEAVGELQQKEGGGVAMGSRRVAWH